ncbi:GAF and ANTAR domain-containing protein [Amycolatopsis benzoatilytica]|uniref:GAF and ANTAR domain-containing protein n=1 Tax=Amycolatopsis benzoatilytica TaxID=346045 RepID=UPI00036D1DDB|nr:GAF and ANTAR domain-containing protein [Amycolatopsis benzoatilytica]
MRERQVLAQEPGLLQAFVDLADTLADGYAAADLLRRLAGYCVTLLSAGAAGLLLADRDGKVQVIAATGDTAPLFDALRDVAGHCVDTVRTGQPVHVPDLAAISARSPEFVSQALEAGYHAAHALPLRLRDNVVGSLVLLSAEPLPETEVAAARALADVATIGILQESAVRRGKQLSGQLQHALDSRVVIEQAKGVLAHAGGIPVDTAFERLRAYSRRHNLRLTAVAEELAHAALPPGQVLRDSPR